MLCIPALRIGFFDGTLGALLSGIAGDHERARVRVHHLGARRIHGGNDKDTDRKRRKKKDKERRKIEKEKDERRIVLTGTLIRAT